MLGLVMHQNYPETVGRSHWRKLKHLISVSLDKMHYDCTAVSISNGHKGWVYNIHFLIFIYFYFDESFSPCGFLFTWTTLLEIISSNNLCAVTFDIKQSLNSQNPVNFIMKIIK